MKLAYNRLTFAKAVFPPGTPHNITEAHIDQGYEITRDGDYYHVRHEGFAGAVLEVHASQAYAHGSEAKK